MDVIVVRFGMIGKIVHIVVTMVYVQEFVHPVLLKPRIVAIAVANLDPVAVVVLGTLGDHVIIREFVYLILLKLVAALVHKHVNQIVHGEFVKERTNLQAYQH